MRHPNDAAETFTQGGDALLSPQEDALFYEKAIEIVDRFFATHPFHGKDAEKHYPTRRQIAGLCAIVRWHPGKVTELASKQRTRIEKSLAKNGIPAQCRPPNTPGDQGVFQRGSEEIGMNRETVAHDFWSMVLFACEGKKGWSLQQWGEAGVPPVDPLPPKPTHEDRSRQNFMKKERRNDVDRRIRRAMPRFFLHFTRHYLYRRKAAILPGDAV